MADTSNTTVILVGAFALAGTVVGQAFSLISGLITGRVDRRHKREVAQKERLEKMVDDITVTLAWFPALTKCRTLEEITSAPPPPEARHAAMLASLYFPSLVDPARDYVNGLVRYYEFATGCFQSGVPATLGAQKAMAVSRNSSLTEREQEPLILRQRLDDAIAAEAKKYSHA